MSSTKRTSWDELKFIANDAVTLADARAAAKRALQVVGDEQRRSNQSAIDQRDRRRERAMDDYR
jgi:hypothetical protein